MKMLSAFLLLSTITTAALGQGIYKWTDARDVVHYAAQPPAQSGYTVGRLAGSYGFVWTAPDQPVPVQSPIIPAAAPSAELSPAALPALPAASVDQAGVKVVDLTNYRSPSGDYIQVDGILQNTLTTAAQRVQVKLRALDDQGKLVRLDDGYANPPNLASGRQATFRFMVPYDARIHGFEVMPQWQ